MKDTAILAKTCISYDSLIEYLEKKAKNHKRYKFYTQEENLNYIINEQGLFLSNGGNWNDISDRESFQNSEDGFVKFGMCFSFSISESVAMWMLYGGNNKKGIMINFKQKLIKNILNGKYNVVLGRWDKYKKFIPIQKIENNQCKFQLVDILYYGENDDNTISIKRADERIDNVNIDIINELRYQKKSYPWNYENECRLIVLVNKNYIKDENINSLKICIDDLYSYCKDNIYCSPNYEKTDTENSVECMKSNLKGSIDWDLCYGCKIMKEKEQ